MTWTPLLLTISILTVYVFHTYYLTTFKPRNLLPDEKGYTFSNVAAFIYLGRKDELTSVFYKFPHELSRFNYYMRHVLTRCLLFAGFVSTIMWVLINYTQLLEKITQCSNHLLNHYYRQRSYSISMAQKNV